MIFDIVMKRTHCIFLTAILLCLIASIPESKGQTIDELNTRIKQLEAEKRTLEAKVKTLQKSKNKSAAEAEESMRLLLEENDSLWAEISAINAAEKAQSKAETEDKSIKINIKDPWFLDYLMRYCDMDNDGILSQWDAKHTYVIDIGKDKSFLSHFGNSNQIKSIEGIEHFVNLKRFVCSGNSIPQMDLSKNTLLETFIANGCELKLLDVSNNDKLIHLECSNNLLYTIDLKNNPSLQTLDVSKNKMTTIDISGCPRLKRLNCSGNALINLDVSNNIELQTIDCSNNKLTTLSFAKNTVLDNINCSNNKLTDLDVRNGIDIKFIDCSKNKDLEFVYFGKGCRVLSDKRDPKTYFK